MNTDKIIICLVTVALVYMFLLGCETTAQYMWRKPPPSIPCPMGSMRVWDVNLERYRCL